MATKRSTTRRPSRRKGRALHRPSFVGGVLLGAAGAVLVMFAVDFVSEQFAGQPEATTGQDDLEVVFEFPELLREPVPVDPESYGGSAARPNVPAPGAAQETNPTEVPAGDAEPAQAAPVRITEIYIQAASFRDAGEADQLRARLLLQGLPVNQGQVVLGDGTWHRVTVGPIDSAEQADTIMTRLREQNLSAIRINPG